MEEGAAVTTPAELRAELDDALARLKALVAHVPAEAWSRPTVNPGWSARDLLAHLVSAETGNLSIARRILQGEGQPVAGFDLARWNQRQIEKLGARMPAELLAELERARQETLQLLASLSVADLDRAGFRTTGEPTTVAGVFQQIARHLRAHTEEIRAATQGS
jgi:uncharacterized protein (TIGR03083 family)